MIYSKSWFVRHAFTNGCKQLFIMLGIWTQKINGSRDLSSIKQKKKERSLKRTPRQKSSNLKTQYYGDKIFIFWIEKFVFDEDKTKINILNWYIKTCKQSILLSIYVILNVCVWGKPISKEVFCKMRALGADSFVSRALRLITERLQVQIQDSKVYVAQFLYLPTLSFERDMKPRPTSPSPEFLMAH